MYAIVDIAGQQFKVEKEQKLFVHRIEGKEESKVSFDDVLLIETNEKVTIGTPVIEGAKVTAKILEHMKGDKVVVFKKKRRKGYQTLNGHRQLFTQIVIENIEEKGQKAPKGKPTKAAVKKVEGKAEETAPGTTKEKSKNPGTKKAVAKTAAKPKATKKKPAVKKSTKAEKK